MCKRVRQRGRCGERTSLPKRLRLDRTNFHTGEGLMAVVVAVGAVGRVVVQVVPGHAKGQRRGGAHCLEGQGLPGVKESLLGGAAGRRYAYTRIHTFPHAAKEVISVFESVPTMRSVG